jgi:hypothetical protein
LLYSCSVREGARTLIEASLVNATMNRAPSAWFVTVAGFELCSEVPFMTGGSQSSTNTRALRTDSAGTPLSMRALLSVWLRRLGRQILV